MKRDERGRTDEDNQGTQQSQPSQSSSFDSFIKWGAIGAAAAVGAGIAYKAVKKESQKDVDEEEFHKHFESFSRSRQENKNSLDYIVKCLSHAHISCNKHNQNGFAPLHLACKEGNITAVQAVLPFQPDLQLRSLCGKTPIELLRLTQSEEKNSERVKELSIIEYMLQAVGDDNASSQASWPMEGNSAKHQLERYNVANQTFISFIPDPSKIPKQTSGIKPIRALCVDGGGTRGFVPLELLQFIENWSPLHDPLPEEQPSIKNSFDWMVGTSTGGIIILYLALGHTVMECRRLYFLLKDKIFNGPKPYNVDNYEGELKAAFGDKRMRDITGVKVVITATTGSVKELTSVLFTNYDEDTKNEYIWTVARMSSAAPYFFTPYLHTDGKRYYDGGLTANNPTLAFLSELTRLNENLTNGIIVSLGTGKPPLSVNVNLDFSSRLGIVGVIQAAAETLINQVCQSDGGCIRYAQTTCTLGNCSYYRLTPTLPEDIVLDETDNEKLLNMIYHTKAYIKLYKTDISKMCERLMTVSQESGSCSIM